MLDFVYRGPDGTVINNPDDSVLRELLLEKGGEYWNSNSGDAGIRILDEAHRAEIVLVYSDGNGFFIQHRYEEEEDEHVIRHSNDLSRKIRVINGGDPWELPESFFCSRNETLDVLLNILKTGKRDTDQDWVNMWEGDWDQEL